MSGGYLVFSVTYKCILMYSDVVFYCRCLISVSACYCFLFVFFVCWYERLLMPFGNIFYFLFSWQIQYGEPYCVCPEEWGGSNCEIRTVCKDWCLNDGECSPNPDPSLQPTCKWVFLLQYYDYSSFRTLLFFFMVSTFLKISPAVLAKLIWKIFSIFIFFLLL